MISWNGKTLNLAIGLGQYDDMIRSRAQAVKALGEKVLIRWMWEMDGREKAENTQHPALYIAAWRHIHDVFAEEGASNVQWVWCPNATAFRIEDDRNAPAYYPGDDYVDWICADGYNWAPGRTERPVAQLRQHLPRLLRVGHGPGQAADGRRVRRPGA